MDLPCIIESQKTTDRKNFYQTASISQIIICTQGDDGVAPIRGSAAYVPPKDLTCGVGPQNISAQPPSTSAVNEKDPRLYQYLHGITPPLKNALRRRFRKTRKKKAVDLSQVEQEVKNMLKNDLRADDVTWEISWVDTSSEQHQQTTKQSTAGAEGAFEVDAGDSIVHRDAVQEEESSRLKSSNSTPILDLSPTLAGGGQGGRRHHVATDELFGAVSSSSSTSNSSSINSSSAAEEESDVEEGEGPNVTKENSALFPDAHLQMEGAGISGMDDDHHQYEKVTEGAEDEQMKTALLLSDSESTAGDDESDGYPGIENSLSPQEIANRYQQQLRAQQEANDKATATAAAEIEEELNVEEYADDEERVDMIASHHHAGEDYEGGIDIMMDEDEDDDFVPAGGELLADDESVSIFQQHDNTPLGAIDLPYQRPNVGQVVFSHLSDDDDEGSHFF
nr:Transcription initiation factor TFIID subunit [Hymenolepis microstoma]